jgi:hypothetical protein
VVVVPVGQNFEGALRRADAIAPLFYVLSDYLAQQCFRKLANLRMFTYCRGQRATAASDKKPFPFLLKPGSAANRFQCA